jgi:hypothetical protein
MYLEPPPSPPETGRPIAAHPGTSYRSRRRRLLERVKLLERPRLLESRRDALPVGLVQVDGLDATRRSVTGPQDPPIPDGLFVDDGRRDDPEGGRGHR